MAIQGQANQEITRRSFIERLLLAMGVVSAGAIATSVGYVIGNNDERSTASANGAEAHGNHTSTAPSQQAPAPNEVMSVDEMDAHHEQGLKDFIANQTSALTKGKGNQPLEPTIENGVKVFRLTCDEIPDWEVSPGRIVAARGYNGAVPGPILRATEGERVRIIVKNNLTESTTVHWHGLLLPNNMDGVPFLNQPPIKPGETFTYEFTLRNSGTHMYHSHNNSMDQVNRGLLGAFIIDPADPASYPQYDREYVMVLNDMSLGFTINGKGFPATEALFANLGERVLIRYLNEGVMHHPMHLHGMPMQVIRKDGYPVNPPQMCDTLDVAPGNRYDVIVEATEPGPWVFHCHVLSHAEGPQGMFGMVTAMLVDTPVASLMPGSAAPAAARSTTANASFVCEAPEAVGTEA